jgi:18S rRNA (guanine1575-N7)-methyltransferase
MMMALPQTPSLLTPRPSLHRRTQACRKKTKKMFAGVHAHASHLLQAVMLTNAAMRAGFSGGMVVDYPNSTRAKKYFLVLMVGGGGLPSGKGGDGEEGGEEETSGEDERTEVEVGDRRRKRAKGAKGGDGGRSRAWILKKKQQQRGRGYVGIKPDTKYTGRKRKDRF